MTLTNAAVPKLRLVVKEIQTLMKLLNEGVLL